MKYFIVGFIQNDVMWYMSIVDPSRGSKYVGTLTPALAVKFATKQEAIAKRDAFVMGKKIRGAFVCEYNIIASGETAA